MVWALVTHMTEPLEASGAWFMPGPGLTVSITWGVNYWVQDVSFSFPLLLSVPSSISGTLTIK